MNNYTRDSKIMQLILRLSLTVTVDSHSDQDELSQVSSVTVWLSLFVVFSQSKIFALSAKNAKIMRLENLALYDKK